MFTLLSPKANSFWFLAQKRARLAHYPIEKWARFKKAHLAFVIYNKSYLIPKSFIFDKNSNFKVFHKVSVLKS